MLDRRDYTTLRQWLISGATLAEVEETSEIGLVGNVRFSPRAKRVYRWLWTWSAFRFGGYAGRLQNEVYYHHGTLGIDRRVARVNRIIQRIKETPCPDTPST